MANLVCKHSYNDCMKTKASVIQAMYNSRNSRKKLCETGAVFCGSGMCAKMTLKQLKQHILYKSIPRGTRINNKPKSKANKAELVNYIDRPKVVFLTLDKAYDPNNSISPISLEESLPNIPQCSQYDFLSHSMVSLNKLMEFFKQIPTKTVACIYLVTHGDVDSLSIGNTDVKIDTPRFNRLCASFKRTMMKEAHVVLIACNTGFVSKEELGRQSNSKIYSYKDTDYNNIANKISKRTSRVVYATPKTQAPDTLMVGWKNSRYPICSELGKYPLNYKYLFEDQPTYVFYSTAV